MRRFGICLLVGFGLAFAMPRASAEPPTSHEIIYTRPSGFWTSNRPAEGGAYRWRLLGIGGALVLTTGLLTWRLIKRASASRIARFGARRE
ncbi:MAG: hypothetical protein JWO36_757 [Myxococcales bacterium]|nr:hypothetical protein [Myxococcales bacterium]